MDETYHYGQTIKEYRLKRGMSQAELAEKWPSHPVNTRYVQFIENGERKIADQDNSGTLASQNTIRSIPTPYQDAANACIKRHSISLIT